MSPGLSVLLSALSLPLRRLPPLLVSLLSLVRVRAEQKYTEGRTPGERQDLLLALQSHELRRDALGLGISGHRTKPKDGQ